MKTVKKYRQTIALLLAVPLIVGLAACGTADPGPTPEPEGDQTQTFESFDEYQLAFAECMRGKGIDMADPKSGSQSFTQADDAFMAAAESCQSEVGRPPAREGDSDTEDTSAETLREEHVKIAECLREHGVDVPDPAPGDDLAIPSDVPADAFETCAPNGVMGATSGGSGR